MTHRQRPATASGITFMNLEDEHGLVNVICSVGVWNRYRRVVRDSPALIVRGMLERSAEGVTNLLADRFEDLRVGVAAPIARLPLSQPRAPTSSAGCSSAGFFAVLTMCVRLMTTAATTMIATPSQ